MQLLLAPGLGLDLKGPSLAPCATCRCPVCGSPAEDGLRGPMLLCDGCDCGCHVGCHMAHAGTALEAVPDGEWYCKVGAGDRRPSPRSFEAVWEDIHAAAVAPPESSPENFVSPQDCAAEIERKARLNLRQRTNRKHYAEDEGGDEGEGEE